MCPWRVVLALGVLFISACKTADDSQALSTGSAAPTEAKVRVHVLGWLSGTDNWYEDEFRHVIGADVDVKARPGKNGGIYVDISSKESRKTSGCALTIYLREDAGTAFADVLGNWWMDIGSPSQGHLSEFEGDIYLKNRIGQSTLLEMRFALTAKKQKERILLMGGVSVVPSE